MKCPNCGNLVEENSIFCTNCGDKLDNAQANPQNGNCSELAQPETAAAFEPQQGDRAEQKPAYVNTAALAKKPAKPAVRAEPVQQPRRGKKRDIAPTRPISTWGFVWRALLFMIPVLNLVFLFTFAFADGVNENSRSYARSRLIFLLIMLIITVIGAVLCYVFREQITDWFVRFSENLRDIAN